MLNNKFLNFAGGIFQRWFEIYNLLYGKKFSNLFHARIGLVQFLDVAHMNVNNVFITLITI